MESTASCPRCERTPLAPPACAGCGLAFALRGGVIDLLGGAPREPRARQVEAFYARSPFPGYAEGDTAAALLDRSRRSAFLRALDAALPSDARVLDVGAGTAQLAAFLALAAPRRRVLALDGCGAALASADAFRARERIANLALVRADLFDLPIAPASQDFVLSRGVVHHTPDPDAAIRCVARCVAPGGTLVLGFYESWARLFHRARRRLGRLVGRPIAALDPVLRARDVDPEKRRIWIDDQYRHPLEHVLGLPRVVRVLEGLGFGWVRSVPPLPEGLARLDAAGGAGPHGLLRAEPRPGRLARLRLRAGWCARGPLDPDAGLVCVIARRQSLV